MGAIIAALLIGGGALVAYALTRKTTPYPQGISGGLKEGEFPAFLKPVSSQYRGPGLPPDAKGSGGFFASIFNSPVIPNEKPLPASDIPQWSGSPLSGDVWSPSPSAVLGALGRVGPAPPQGAVTTNTNDFDDVIQTAAEQAGMDDPAMLKAIVAKESGFNPYAVNPEGTYVLDGTRYTAGDMAGRGKLAQYIQGGGDPGALGINPSIGLAQVRLSTARKILNSPHLTAQQLYSVSTNLLAAAALLKQLFDAGITIDTIDAYNVGQDLSPRNLPYRDDVKRFYQQFAKG